MGRNKFSRPWDFSLARSLLDLLYWSSLRSLLRTYERSTCSKSKPFKVPSEQNKMNGPVWKKNPVKFFSQWRVNVTYAKEKNARLGDSSYELFYNGLFCEKKNLKQGAHKYQSTAWPVPHAYAQPYHPGSGSHGQRFRLCWHTDQGNPWSACLCMAWENCRTVPS